MAREPQREREPRHLDAKLVPIEHALLARAKDIQARVDTLMAEAGDDTDKMLLPLTLASVAEEFRALAEELHYW